MLSVIFSQAFYLHIALSGRTIGQLVRTKINNLLYTLRASISDH